MAWSAGFIAALSRSNRARITIGRVSTFSVVPGSGSDVASTDQDGTYPAISPGAPVALSSQSLSVPSFAISSSQWRIALGTTTAGKWAVDTLPRGAACEVLARLRGGFFQERVILGQARDVSGIGPQSIVSGWGALSLVISRPEAAASPSVNDAALFAECQEDGNALALSSGFNFGTDTTLQFASAPPFARETGRPGAVLITPTSGDPFIVTYTGISGNNLTGVSTTAEHGTSGSGATVNSGDLVQEVCWIDRHPVDMARHILTSTGFGSNGAHDTLPRSWGLNVPVSLVDTAGFDAVRQQLNDSLASGTHTVHTVSTTPQGPALQWIQSELARYGLWLVERQGQISIRAAFDYWRTRPTPVLALTDRNLIAALPERSNYDGSLNAEAVYFTIRGDPGDVPSWAIINEAPQTRPLIATIAEGPIVDSYPWVYQNEAAINLALARRIGPWHLRVGTIIDCRATLEAAQLCCGDWVTIQHRGLWDHSTGPYAPNPTRAAMVVGVSCDWSAGVVTLRLHVQHTATAA